MNPILLAVIIVAAIGLIAGIGLAVASVVMAVPKDEKAEAIEGVLPGANCGACGFSGCAGYAAALSKGEAKVGLCSPGGADVADAIGEILGV
ncbi:MAG: RnfABCDGE type electron transport complex subunit B, partial [Clostridia bacterium]|nr:RnfABCDGE type electron transport complex subunit B [Clostridia bacterium]